MSIAGKLLLPDSVDDEDLYPAEDGEPMAETQIHIHAIILLFQALEDYLAQRLDIYIAADMFWYWEKGNVGARRAPDVLVIKGVGRRVRRSFLCWQENEAVPCVIFEMASKGTWREWCFCAVAARWGWPVALRGIGPAFASGGRILEAGGR